MSVDELKVKGNSCNDKGEYEQALNFYDRAIRLNGNCDSPLNAAELSIIRLDKAQVLLKLERFSDAYEEAKVALANGVSNEAMAHYRFSL